MNQFGLTAEQQQIRDMVREFVVNEVIPAKRAPRVVEAFEPLLPAALYSAASQLGLRYLTLSESAGGPGSDELTFCLVAEELARGDAGLAVQFCLTAALCDAAFNNLADEAKRNELAGTFIEDEGGFLAFVGGVVEHRGLGSDYFTREFSEEESLLARRRGDGWLLSGQVPSVDGAPVAKWLIVRAREEGGIIRYFYLPSDREGISIKAREKEKATSHDYFTATISWKHGPHGAVSLEDCPASAADELIFFGEVPALLAGGRAQTWRDAISLGIARAAFDEATAYSTMRVQGGKPIGQHEAVGILLSRMAIKLEAGRLLLWQAANSSAAHANGAEATSFTLSARSIASVFISEAAKEITLDSAEVFGAMGVMRDMPLAALVRDSLISSVAGLGVDQSLREISRAIAEYSAQ